MNERIKELWETSDEIKLCYPEQGSPVSVSAETLEKFAELIVRECGEVAWRHTPETEELEYSHLIRSKILEHFGVEE
jgi:hypothetical protein